jgi:hypothetical protein
MDAARVDESAGICPWWGKTGPLGPHSQVNQGRAICEESEDCGGRWSTIDLHRSRSIDLSIGDGRW